MILLCRVISSKTSEWLHKISATISCVISIPRIKPSFRPFVFKNLSKELNKCETSLFFHINIKIFVVWYLKKSEKNISVIWWVVRKSFLPNIKSDYLVKMQHRSVQTIKNGDFRNKGSSKSYHVCPKCFQLNFAFFLKSL